MHTILWKCKYIIDLKANNFTKSFKIVDDQIFLCTKCNKFLTIRSKSKLTKHIQTELHQNNKKKKEKLYKQNQKSTELLKAYTTENTRQKEKNIFQQIINSSIVGKVQIFL
ncbi:hypothetical protein M0811_13565 [Anaeramoeba ignava]|uniref:Uncharacterized protein n=1 Tax=Anaeramoeba ignava TaxID=1746090 RepID=A0A9Q0R593_ANAIG|nr:hypothetical protein M0811_13565 [Anaeramoeba ignava]